MSDLKQINGIWYDFNPPNDSFKLTAKELKVLGIKNFYFMFRIDHPELADIDPFNPRITRQEIDALMIEYRSNPWMFMRTAVKLRTDSGIVQYGLHRGLAAATWCAERHYDFCLCEPRQTWKTTGLIGGPLQWAFQLSSNLHMQFFGKETENTKRNLATLKDDISLLPEWLQFKRYMGSDGKIKKSRQATETLENNLMHNKLIIHPKPTSLSHAQGLARGDSGAILYFDEIEHTPFFGELLSNSAPLFKTAYENAAAASLPYFRAFSCTPGNLDTREGLESLPIIKSMIPWTEKIYDMTPEEIEEYKNACRDEYHNSEEKHEREVTNIFYMEYQYYQVRKTYKWVLEQYALSGDKMAIRREILLQRLRGSNNSPISPEDIEYLISNMRKSDNDIIIDKKWRFRLYEHGQGYQFGRPKDFDEHIPYIVGIDPAGGGGGDNFAVTIVNPYNLQIAAEFKSPYISGPNAVRMLIRLVEDYIPNAVLIPEKNSMGIYLIQMLCETSIKKNLYWSQKTNQLEEMVTDSPDMELKMLSEQYKKYGHWTGPKTRPAMFELLFQHVNECKQILTTEYLVDDICKLIRTPTGRYEAVKGEHDDCLMSYLIVLFCYYTGDNLEYFGIIKNDHPIFGPIQLNTEETDERDPFSGFFSTKQVTFDELVMEDAARMEEEIKEIVFTLDYVHDEVYSNMRNPNESKWDGTVDISPFFFDQVNGV